MIASDHGIGAQKVSRPQYGTIVASIKLQILALKSHNTMITHDSVQQNYKWKSRK